MRSSPWARTLTFSQVGDLGICPMKDCLTFICHLNFDILNFNLWSFFISSKTLLSVISAHHKGRTLLSMIGIALGVAVFVSVQIAIHTAIESFNASVDHVSGKANLQVTSFGRGFPEEVYLKVKKVPGVKAATPVIQYVSKIDEPIGEPLYLLGIDVFSDRPFREYQFYENEDEVSFF